MPDERSKGAWSSAVPGLPTTGNIPLFEDGRITLFEERLGGFARKQVLELGPLEGGHTYSVSGATIIPACVRVADSAGKEFQEWSEARSPDAAISAPPVD
jgi:hypothetical protein